MKTVRETIEWLLVKVFAFLDAELSRVLGERGFQESIPKFLNLSRTFDVLSSRDDAQFQALGSAVSKNVLRCNCNSFCFSPGGCNDC